MKINKKSMHDLFNTCNEYLENTFVGKYACVYTGDLCTKQFVRYIGKIKNVSLDAIITDIWIGSGSTNSIPIGYILTTFTTTDDSTFSFNLKYLSIFTDECSARLFTQIASDCEIGNIPNIIEKLHEIIDSYFGDMLVGKTISDKRHKISAAICKSVEVIALELRGMNISAILSLKLNDQLVATTLNDIKILE